MAAERPAFSASEIPPENFARGLFEVVIPELSTKTEGKVRDIYIVEKGNKKLRVMVTTDRQSAFDRLVCTIPDKGQVLNLISAFWFENTVDIVPNQMIAVPHPNVLIARQAEVTLPVELIFRRYMARSSTKTSVYYNYADLGRKKIYGIEFPEGLQPNQEFPMRTISTPTTKALSGQHDLELTDEEAEALTDRKLGRGIWKEAKAAGLALFERAFDYHRKNGLILADTKFEFGLDQDGELMLIDEVFTPDSSRFWLAHSYNQRIKEGINPESFDKEILRRWLAGKGFTGEGQVPVVDPKIIDQMANAYKFPYEMITGNSLPQESNQESIRNKILQYLNN